MTLFEDIVNDMELIVEDRGSKNLHKVRSYISSRYPNENPQKIVDAIRHDIPNVRLPKVGNTDTYKFMLGVTRMYLDGELRNGTDIMDLNKTLKYVATDAHFKEYDENLNGLTARELVDRFKTVATQDVEGEKERLSKMQYTKSGYKIVPIDNAEKAAKYGKYTTWCVTHDKGAYEQYTGGGFGRFYFCLRNGFQNAQKVKGDNCPLDEYGLSMIAVSVNYDGSPNTITCRWNHDNGGNDNVMTPEQVSKLVGGSFYELFKPYTKEELRAKGFIQFDEVQGMLDGDIKPRYIFSRVGDFYEGFAEVQLNGKYNFINEECKLLSDTWFDSVYRFRDGFARVELNNKWNSINTEGKLLSNTWFDGVGDFYDGVAKVRLEGKYNYINTEGKLLSDTWFDNACIFSEGVGLVTLKDKHYIINTEGQLYDYNTKQVLSNQQVNEQNKINKKIKENTMKKKQTVRLNESQLHRIIKESVKKVLKETSRYSGGYNRHGDIEDDDAYVDSLDYIIDSVINGNWSYAEERISELKPREVKELIMLAREYGGEVENNIMQAIENCR